MGAKNQSHNLPETEISKSKESAVISQRVTVYIDGFNLYFGLKEARLRRFLWLDILELGKSFLKAGQSLSAVKYFTAPISGPLKYDSDQKKMQRKAKRTRQSTYLSALRALDGLEVIEGHYSGPSRNSVGRLEFS